LVKQDRRPLVAITGAGGRVGVITIRALQPYARLRLIDRAWPEHSRGEADADYVTADLRIPRATRAALAGADVVVHLAANASPEQNAAGAVEGVGLIAANVADALEHLGTGRLVFASSVHAMGMYDVEGDHPVQAGWKQRPCCDYGASKVLAENVFELLHRRTRMPVLGLRLGLTGYPPTEASYVGQWLGENDYSRMIRAAVERSAGFGLVFAMSPSAAERWDLTETERVLGWRPSDNAIIRVRTGQRIGGPTRCLMLRRMHAKPGATSDDGTN
jgi:hypothetical protein